MALKDILESIKHPHKVTFEAKDLTDTYGKFIAQPFEKGYAVTVGNALRRVLLSSIPAYAISAIKIPGVTNEYQNIDGVKEDTIVVIMHLKSVVLALIDDEDTKTIHIKKQGPCTIVAKDIADADSSVKVFNPDHHIATVADGTTFEMDLQIEGGYGYVPSEMNSDLLEDVNALVIDAVYSPVTNVRFDVEDVRVGQRIDYGKLVLEIETKGNIRPEKALSWATKILRDNLLCFLMPEELENAEAIKEEAPKNSVLDSLKSKAVDEVEFSIRTASFLTSCDLKTLDKVAQKTERELLSYSSANKMIVDEIKEKLEEYGASLGLKS